MRIFAKLVVRFTDKTVEMQKNLLCEPRLIKNILDAIGRYTDDERGRPLWDTFVSVKTEIVSIHWDTDQIAWRATLQSDFSYAISLPWLLLWPGGWGLGWVEFICSHPEFYHYNQINVHIMMLKLFTRLRIAYLCRPLSNSWCVIYTFILFSK